MGFEAMLAGYEAWKKTPLGKEYIEKSKSQKSIEIKPLPDGWFLRDGGVEEGFFVYSNDDDEIDITVQDHFGMPCWCGGYPKLQYIEVSRIYNDETEERVVAKFNVYKLGWDEAFKQANEFAKSKMERD